MISRIKNLFKKKDTFKLTNLLQKEHQSLLYLLNRIHMGVLNDDFETSIDNLNKFEILYKLHVEIEEQELYLILKELFKNDTKLGYIISLENDAKMITEQILTFIDNYRQIDNENKNDFLNNLSKIETILKDRISLEENKLFELFECKL